MELGAERTSQTFGDRLAAAGGRPSGFDYLRVLLASAVILFHSFDLTAGYNVAYHQYYGIFRPFDVAIVPMFFALSGFLVAGSLERSSTLISFIGLRVIRLLPALLVETVLSAIFIGLLFSTLKFRDYVENPLFLKYFLNILGDIHFLLPGVFQTNIYPDAVNGQLWTLPWELKCYAAIAFLSLVGITKRRSAFLYVIFVGSAAIFTYHTFVSAHPLGHQVRDKSIVGISLIESFLCGILFYLFRNRIRWSRNVFFSSAVCSFIVLSLPLAFWGDYLIPLPITYLTVYLGLLQPHRSTLVTSGDYSYGIYLYGFPVQQSVVATLGSAGQYWWLNFALSMPITVLISVFSWHLIEKQAARLRPALFNLEQLALRRLAIGKNTKFALSAKRPAAASERLVRLSRTEK